MSPYEIGVMLHYYCIGIDHDDMCRNPPIWQPTITNFLDAGLLELSEGSSRYKITEKGTAYCNALQDVQLPICKWVQP